MITNERIELLKIIKNQVGNKACLNFSALSDAELRQEAQKILSAVSVKKKLLPKKTFYQKKILMKGKNSLRKG